jgi:molybdopterin molybdotransferase
VVIQEACTAQGDEVTINELPALGANIRRAGEDIAGGETILNPGTLLKPQHLGLAASVGISDLKLFRRLRVALFSSGDELVMPGEPLGPGQIYNSNQFTLAGLVRGLGCEVKQIGIVEDSLEATREALSRGAGEADLVLASGGVSVGEEDHVKPAVEQLGSLELWKVAMRPGKPLAFGQIQGVPFLGMPGNPVSLFVTFVLFVRPFILKQQGVAGSVLPRAIRVRAGFDWQKPAKRREYARGRLIYDENMAPLVELFPSRSSAVLSSVTWANGLVVIPENRVFSRGDPVDFVPFAELQT